MTANETKPAPRPAPRPMTGKPETHGQPQPPIRPAGPSKTI